MRHFTLIISLISLAFLAACKEDEPTCTPQLLNEKAKEIETLAVKIAAEDPAKMEEIAKKMETVISAPPASDGDLQASCTMMDDILKTMK